MDSTDSLTVSGIRDSLKRLFDPKKFRLNSEGKPRFDKLGRFVNLRAGRKPKIRVMPSPDTTVKNADAGSDAPVTAQAPEQPGRSQPSLPSPQMSDGADAQWPDFSEIEAALKTPSPSGPSNGSGAPDDLEGATVDSIIDYIEVALVLLGEEEGELSAAEKKMLRRPLDRVLRKYNIGVDILPAELELAAVFALIVIRRLTKPKTKSKFQQLTLWAKQKYLSLTGWFGGFSFKKSAPAAKPAEGGKDD